MAKHTHSLARGQRLDVTIESYGAGGEGVAKIDGIPLFIDGVAVGDLVEVELFDVRKGFALGKSVSVKSRSSDRVEPACPVAEECGGCHWQHISYDAQLRAKKVLVEQALIRVGRLEDIVVEPVEPSCEQLGYRNKAQFPVQRGSGKLNISAGYYKKKSHELIDIDRCPVQPEPLDELLRLTKEVLHRYRIEAYQEKTNRGLVRHICARISRASGKALLTLVLNCRGPEDLSDEMADILEGIGDEVMGAMPFLSGFCLNFNAERSNKILGDETVCVRGEGQIREVLRSELEDAPDPLKEGLSFELSPDSFFQVNSAQAALMLDEVLKEARRIKGESEKFFSVDAYAGVGSIAQWLSFISTRVMAVEVNSSAVADGIANLEANSVDNVEFVEGTAEDVLAELAKDGERPDLVVLDPPRKGCSRELLDALLALAPRNVIYVSCNPATLARDLAILRDGNSGEADGEAENIGYKTIYVKPFDLFPQTYHVETVVTLEKFSQDGSIGNLEKV